MASADRRARERENLRRAILDAARELFITEDYAAVSMRRIAEKIEYSPTAIYLYFKSKEEIILHLAEEGFNLLKSDLQKVESPDPMERLQKAGPVYIRFAINHTEYFKIMFEVKNQALDDSMNRFKEMGEGAFLYIGQAVHEAIAQGKMKPGNERIISHIIWAAVHGVAELAIAGRLTKLPEEHHALFFQEMCDTLLRGLAA